MAIAPKPIARTIATHLTWLVQPCLANWCNARLEIAWGQPDQGPCFARTFSISDLRRAVSFATWMNGKGCNLYVGATLKSGIAPLRGRTNSNHALVATCLAIDIDQDFETASRLAAKYARPQLLVITGETPVRRGQLFVRVQPSVNLAAWEEIQERLVLAAGADRNALGRNQLFRLGGTISFPSKAKAERGYETERTSLSYFNSPSYELEKLSDALPRAKRPVPQVCERGELHSADRTASHPSLKAITRALAILPDEYADKRELWLRVGFALLDFDPSRRGLTLWVQFSKRSPTKAKATDFGKLWEGFARPYSGKRITVFWLLREARKFEGFSIEVCR